MSSRSPSGSGLRSRVALAAVGVIALSLVAIPREPPTALELEAARQRHALRLARGELAGAIREYRDDHGTWPGIAPEGAHDRPHGARWLRDQLLGATDARGRPCEPAATDRERFPFGPYLSAIPPNPLDGSARLHVVGRDDSGPERPRGTGGWLFDPRAGLLRSNAASGEQVDADGDDD